MRCCGAHPSCGGACLNQDNLASVIEYPCDFPIKVMGNSKPGFAQAIVEIVQRHAPDFDAATVEMRMSREKKYMSVTATVRAISREQLDALYRELSDHPMVVMVL